MKPKYVGAPGQALVQVWCHQGGGSVEKSSLLLHYDANLHCPLVSCFPGAAHWGEISYMYEYLK